MCYWVQLKSHSERLYSLSAWFAMTTLPAAKSIATGAHLHLTCLGQEIRCHPDVVVQGPLLELSDRLCMYAKPGGVILLSGFLIEQWPMIRAAYEEHSENFDVQHEGQWVAVTCTRKQ